MRRSSPWLSASTALLTVALVVACKGSTGSTSADVDAGACTSPDFSGAPLGVHCNALVDAEGRTVLLHGINARVDGVFDVTFTDGRAPLEAIPAFTIDDAKRIRAIGFNALRLPIQWSGVEPTATGGFDESYLGRVAAVVDLCRQASLLVLVDLHQDGYSKEIGEDGAPLWAILPPPTQLLGGPLTNLGDRRLSKQVQDAFTTFFGPSTDGAMLRDRFAKMAAHVAARFANDAAVFGFELFNEPTATDTELATLYATVIPAMRAAAPTKLLVFEPSATRNITDKASIGQGSLGTGTVYAPHIYTFVFTGTNPANLTKDSLRPSNESARAEADGFLAPLVVTEYGYGPNDPSFANYIRWQNELEDEVHASSFLWLWKEESQGSWGFFDHDAASGAFTERPAAVAGVSRIRLEAAAGRIVNVGFDADTKRFEVQLLGDASITAPNIVSLGATPGFTSYDATCDGKPIAHDTADPVSLACGGAGSHTLALVGR